MGIELQSETRILIGKLCAPSDPERPWWWQVSTTIEGAELIAGGFAATEHEAILEAAAGTIAFDWHADAPVAAPKPRGTDRRHEPGWWPGLDERT